MPAFRFALVLHTDGAPAGAEEASRLLHAAGLPVGATQAWADGPLAVALADPVHARPNPSASFHVDDRLALAVVGEVHEAGADLRADPAVGLVTAPRLAAAWCPDRPHVTDQLLADAVLVAWERTARRLHVVRDAFGVVPVYWAQAGGVLVAASELHPVIAHPAVPRRPDEGYLAEELVAHVTSTTDTALADVRRLPPGQVLTVDVHGGRSATRAWYRFPDLPPERNLTPGDAAARMRDAVDRAVAARLRAAGCVAVDVSGGYDSSTIGLVAARLRPPGLRLVATGTDSDDPRADERREAAAVIAAMGVEAVRCHHRPPDREAALDRLARTGHLPILRDEIDRDALGWALAAAGVERWCSGFGGDEFLAGNSPVARDLWWTGHPRAALRALGVTGRPAWRPVWADLVRPVVVDAVPWGLRGRRRPPFPLLTPAFAARTAIWDRVRPPEPPRRFVRPSWRALWRLAVDGLIAKSFELAHLEGALAGIAVRHPFHDRRVAEAALTVPETLRWDGRDWRPLHRAAYGDLLPDEVRARRTKADFTHVGLAQLDAHGGLDALVGSAPVALGWVEPAEVRRQWEITTTRLERPHSLLALASVDLWLRHGPVADST